MIDIFRSFDQGWSLLAVSLKAITLVIFLGYLWESVLFFRELLSRSLKRPRATWRSAVLTLTPFVVVNLMLAAVLLTQWRVWSSLLYSEPWFFFFLLGLVMIILDRSIPIITAAINMLLTPIAAIKKELLISQARETLKSHPRLKVVGITGSYGKSSTKNFLAQILKTSFKVLAAPANINTDIGLAKLILDNENNLHGFDVLIAEMGSYGQGDITKIASIAPPHLSILTGINEQHLALFGNLANTVRAKSEILTSLRQDGVAFFNAENDIVSKLAANYQKPKRLYGLRSGLDIMAKDIQIGLAGTHFLLETKDARTKLFLPLVGRHNVINVLGAIGVALHLGLDVKQIKKTLKTISPQEHALVLKTGPKGSLILDDTYSANPAGVKEALALLKEIPKKRRVVIMRPLIELGEEARNIHQRLGERLAKTADWLFLTHNEYSQDIIKGVRRAGSKGPVRLKQKRIVIQENPAQLARILKLILRRDDVVLLENRLPDVIVKQLLSR